MAKQYQTFNVINSNEADFVRFWSQHYNYPDNYLYDENIDLSPSEQRTKNLYRWKNGTDLSRKKAQSVEAIYVAETNKGPPSVDRSTGRAYLDTLKGGAIWDIFWLHCLDKAAFPIFDQHTYRAMAKITRQSPPEIPVSRTDKLNAYFTTYLSFVDGFSRTIDRRELDKALFAYGRFLKSDFST